MDEMIDHDEEGMDPDEEEAPGVGKTEETTLATMISKQNLTRICKSTGFLSFYLKHLLRLFNFSIFNMFIRN